MEKSVQTLDQIGHRLRMAAPEQRERDRRRLAAPEQLEKQRERMTRMRERREVRQMVEAQSALLEFRRTRLATPEQRGRARWMQREVNTRRLEVETNNQIERERQIIRAIHRRRAEYESMVEEHIISPRPRTLAHHQRLERDRVRHAQVIWILCMKFFWVPSK